MLLTTTKDHMPILVLLLSMWIFPPQPVKHFGMKSVRCEVQDGTLVNCKMYAGSNLDDLMNEWKDVYDSKDCDDTFVQDR